MARRRKIKPPLETFAKGDLVKLVPLTPPPCQHDASGSSPHAESDYMHYGTPVDVGRCARQVIANLTAAAAAGAAGGGVGGAGGAGAVGGVGVGNVLAFVASDNHGSALQVGLPGSPSSA